MSTQTIEEFRRGWRVLLASTIGNGSGLSGIPFFTFGVFVVPLATAFGWSRGRVAIAASFLTLGTAITAPIIGTTIDRFGARRVGIISMIALSLGYALLTRLDGNLMTFYIAWSLMSLIGGGTTPVVWTRAVSLWFDRARGLALGIALAGSGLAGVLAPVLTNRAIARFGWQRGYLALSAFMLVVAVPILGIFFEDRPTTRTDAKDVDREFPGMMLQEALRAPAFWKIAVGFLFVSSVISGLIINLVPLLIDRGKSPAEAARMASVMGLAVLVGRVGIGFLLDRVSASRVSAVLITLAAAGCLMLDVAHLPECLVPCSVIMIGFAVAAEVDLLAYLTGRFLGMRAYGRIYGCQISIFYLSASLGPLVAGVAYDHFHSYLPILDFAAGSLVVGAIVLATLGQVPPWRAEELQW
jgi:predicted MFS family arabinose efflux permease